MIDPVLASLAVQLIGYGAVRQQVKQLVKESEDHEDRLRVLEGQPALPRRRAHAAATGR